MTGSGPTKLFAPDRPGTNLLIRDAYVLDPRAGLDERRDILIRGGLIAELATAGALSPGQEVEVLDGTGVLTRTCRRRRT